MKKSGYQASLEYIEPKVDNTENNTKKLQRKRKIIWFSPSLSKSVTTNLGIRFLNLVEKQFPKEHKLHKSFNKNTLKVSCSCSHNRKVKQTKKDESLPGNCRQMNDCPMDRKCCTMYTVYKCLHQYQQNPIKVIYIGFSEDKWKKRYYNHRIESRYETNAIDRKQCYPVMCGKQNVISTKYHPWYSNITKRCQLRLYEKYAIIKYPDPENLLNKRSEIISKCPTNESFYWVSMTHVIEILIW